MNDKIIKNEINVKIVVDYNKYGFLGADLVIGTKKISITRSLSKFEITWMMNRRERLYVDVVRKEYKGQLYDIVVIRDSEGYDDEYITLKLDYQVKELLVSIIALSNIG